MVDTKRLDFSNYYLPTLILIKIFLTFFYLNIYDNFSSIGDARGYLRRYLVLDINAYFPHILTNRSHFVETIYAFSNTLFSNIITPYIFSILSIIIIWNTCKVYFLNSSKINFYLFLIIIFSPSFALWTSVPSKELITVTLSIYMVSCLVKILVKEKINFFLFLLVTLIFAYIRPNYFLAYFIFLFIIIIKIYFLDRICIRYNIKISKNYYILLLVTSIISLFFLLRFSDNYIIQKIELIIYTSYHMFYAFDDVSTSMRNKYIQWNDYNDFFKYIVFGSFVSFSGPTIEEIIYRPIFVIYFIESLIINLIIIYLFVSLISLNKFIQNFYFIYFFGFFLCFIIALITHYPLGIFNLGSSLRYKQNLLALMIFLPYMLLCYNFNKTASHQ